jgi:hypothetical protein
MIEFAEKLVYKVKLDNRLAPIREELFQMVASFFSQVVQILLTEETISKDIKTLISSIKK